MKKILLLTTIMLAGCQTVVTTQKQLVILPSTSMYNCPTVESYPDPKKLTDVEVAKLIVQLDRYNKICKKTKNKALLGLKPEKKIK